MDSSLIYRLGMSRYQNKSVGVLDIYEELVTRTADPRVADWPFMSAYSPTLILTVLYLLVVCVGPKLLRDRPAFDLRRIMIVYNIALVVINCHIFSEFLIASYRLNYSYSCQPMDYSNNPDEIRIASAFWWYYVSKSVELLDTVFFILRKKNNQVSYFHVYHHASIFPITWMGVKLVPGGQAFLGAMLNSLMHIIMYTYYGISALGPQYQKFVWWKKYLTTLQLTQLTIILVHWIQSIYNDCAFPLYMQWFLIFHTASNIAFFFNFYYHSYISSSKNKLTGKLETNGHAVNVHQNGKPTKLD